LRFSTESFEIDPHKGGFGIAVLQPQQFDEKEISVFWETRQLYLLSHETIISQGRQ
jgi:hypothetical protein